MIKRFAKNLVKAAENWSAHDGNTLSASVAYYAALSFFPLILIFIAIFGLILGMSHTAKTARDELLSLVASNLSVEVADYIKALLTSIETNAAVGGPIGLILLIYAGASMFVQVDTAFVKIWADQEDETPTLRNLIVDVLRTRVKAFAIMGCLGAMMLTVFFLSIAFNAVQTLGARLLPLPWFWQLVNIGIVVVMNAIGLSFLYKFLPKARISWPAATLGGVFTAILWEISRQIFTYLALSNNYSAYGLVGSFIALLLWIYLASVTIFFGAELVKIYANTKKGEGALKGSGEENLVRITDRN